MPHNPRFQTSKVGNTDTFIEIITGLASTHQNSFNISQAHTNQQAPALLAW